MRAALPQGDAAAVTPQRPGRHAAHCAADMRRPAARRGLVTNRLGPLRLSGLARDVGPGCVGARRCGGGRRRRDSDGVEAQG